MEEELLGEVKKETRPYGWLKLYYHLHFVNFVIMK